MCGDILHISRSSFFLHYHPSLGLFPSSPLMFLSRSIRGSACCSKKWKLTSDDARIKVIFFVNMTFLAIVIPPGHPLLLYCGKVIVNSRWSHTSLIFDLYGTSFPDWSLISRSSSYLIWSLIFQSLLALNPTVNKLANAVPSAETKKNKHNWKRNADKGCGVSIDLWSFQLTWVFDRLISSSYLLTLFLQGCGPKLDRDFRDIKHTTLSERAALREALRFDLWAFEEWS